MRKLIIPQKKAYEEDERFAFVLSEGGSSVYGVLLVAFLSIIGGLVAFLGDRVGMRVGRRRVMLFGLRPKYTSMLITVVTGILIVTATLSVLAVVSKDVRTALFHMKQLQRDLSKTRGELVRTEERSRELVETVNALNLEIHDKETEFQGLVERYQITQDLLNQAIERRSAVERQMKLVSSRLESVSQAYQTARANLSHVEANLAFTEQNLRFAQARLAPLMEIQNQLTRVIDQLTVEREQLARDVDTLTAETHSLKEGLKGMLGRQVVFHAGEIVLSTVMECNRSAAEIRHELLTVHLKKANQVAAIRGAQVPGSDSDALQLRAVDLQAAVDQLAALNGKAVLRIISSTNTIAQEPVLVSLQVLPDAKVFEAGEVIAETRVDGRSDVNLIMERILALLEEVNWRAIVEKGMVSDLQGTVGQISSWQEVQDVILQAKQTGKEVAIQACAIEETWRARGPLRVRLVIAPD